MILEAVVIGLVILNIYLLFLWRDLDKKMDFLLNNIEIVEDDEENEDRSI